MKISQAAIPQGRLFTAQNRVGTAASLDSKQWGLLKMALTYASEELYDAVRGLAVGSEDLRERLRLACNKLVTLQLQKIPDRSLANRFAAIINTATANGSVLVTIESISEEECVKLASEMFDFLLNVGAAPARTTQ